ncbi:MAG TPA: zf-HC2 domain-containing protein [Ktedonobacterales bacterium]|nr:zf-HC2 domain-containing protein [Ktedonobacterales bacterium]
MNASTIPTCPLGMTAGDLSAWRDHALTPADERRITAHTSACPACQQVIAAHEALAAIMRSDEPPAPDPRNWTRVQARIASARPATRFAARQWAPRWRRAALWSGMGAAAAALVISALFFSLFSRMIGLRAMAPTTPVAGPTLTWQYQSVPESVIPPLGAKSDVSNIAFAPTDAQTAYICYVDNARHKFPVAIWATHDGAGSWAHVSDLPNTATIAGCMVTVDAHDPLRLNVVVHGQNIYGQNPTTYEDVLFSYVSENGGKTWRTLNAKVALAFLATSDGTSVAVVDPLAEFTGPQSGQSLRLSISHDGFRTWQPIDAQLSASGQHVVRVWQRPGDGALLALALVMTPSSGSFALWSSDDLGAHWTPFPTPSNLSGPSLAFLVAQPYGTAPWQVCGVADAGTSSTPASASQIIGCTRDGGQTWTSRPLPALKASCGAGCLKQQTLSYLSALLPDGSLVAPFYLNPADASAAQPSSLPHIFRLPAGSDHWQDLGSQPASVLLPMSSSSGAALVSFSGDTGNTGESYYDGVSASLISHPGSGASKPGVLAIATLP